LLYSTPDQEGKYLQYDHKHHHQLVLVSPKVIHLITSTLLGNSNVDIP
jgi:hypothetical protein